ncbi:MAG: OsmC family protein [Candidatus Thorarchaeota archaeon]
MSDSSQDEHKYDLESRWVREKIVTIEVGQKPELHIATPPDFWPESPKKLYSPEDLFVAAAVSCYGVSLSGIALRYHAEFKDFHMKATGTLAKGEFGWEFDQITMNAKIIVTNEKDQKKMAKAAERAHTYCLVTNSMKCPIHLDYEVVVEPEE